MLLPVDRCGPPVLVTGANGFLGRYVVNALTDAGHRVVSLSRRAKRDDTIEADLGVGPVSLGCYEFQFVFHLAGLAHMPARTNNERSEFFRVNVDGTRNLIRGLDGARKLPEGLVLASSVAVYGLESGTQLDESTPRLAQDPYGRSKALGEDLVTDWGQRRGIRIGIMRLPLLVGSEAPGNLGALVRAIKSRRYCGIGTGKARRSMVLADDVGRICIAIARSGGVYHLTDGQDPSFAEVEAAVAAALEVPKPHRVPEWLGKLAARFGDVAQGFSASWPYGTRQFVRMTKSLTFSDSHARSVLDWNPRRVLDEVKEWA